jgi:hypothetical protein
MREQASPRPVGRRTALVVVVIGYAALAGATRSFTWPALVVTVIPALVVVRLAVRAPGRRGAISADVPTFGMILWAALVVAGVAWQLAAYFQSPRSDHPTISSMLDAADSYTPLRATVFLGWMVLGVALARR